RNRQLSARREIPERGSYPSSERTRDQGNCNWTRRRADSMPTRVSRPPVAAPRSGHFALTARAGTSAPAVLRTWLPPRHRWREWRWRRSAAGGSASVRAPRREALHAPKQSAPGCQHSSGPLPPCAAAPAPVPRCGAGASGSVPWRPGPRRRPYDRCHRIRRRVRAWSATQPRSLWMSCVWSRVWSWRNGSRLRGPEAPEAQAVGYDAHGAHRHGRAGQNRTEEKPRERKERSRGNRNADHVVDERPEEVLLHDAHRATRQCNRVRHTGEIRAHQRHIARLDGDVGAAADRDAHIRARECGGVIDAIADHRHAASPTPQPFDLRHISLGWK